MGKRRKMSPGEVLHLPMKKNDSGQDSIRGYLRELLLEVWTKEESFSGKRPFGNSGWKLDVYSALVEGGAIGGKLDEDGWVEEVDSDEADEIIGEAIKVLI